MNEQKNAAMLEHGEREVPDIGFCVNCEHAALGAASEICASCYESDCLFRNFARTADKPESQKCDTCSNNVKSPRPSVMLADAGKKGFPCSVCASDYFYHPVSG